MSTVPNGMTDADKTQENTGINSETSGYNDRLELLYEVAGKVSSVPEVSKLLEEILVITQRILQASASSLFLIDQEEQLYVQAAGGKAASALKQQRPDFSSGIVSWVARYGKPAISNDVTRDNRFNKDIDQVTGFVTRSILAVPLMKGPKIIGVMEVLNKGGGRVFDDRDLRVLTGLVSTEALMLLVSMAATAIDNIRQSQTVLDGYKSTIENLVTAVDARDPYALGHSRRVKEYALLAASSFAFSPEELRVVEFGALLHDIGKIGIDESILRESGLLTTEDWCIIREHPLKGANIVEDIPYLGMSRDIILNHHEWYDGTGYPAGLKGENIPIGARLVAVADAFDTMITDHSYRAALSVDEAIAQLIKCSGTQFCPVAVEAFISEFKKDAKKSTSRKGNEARKVKSPDKRAKREAKETAKEEVKKAPADISSEIYEGEVQLVVLSPVGFEQMRQFQECLGKVENLKMTLVGGSVDEGAMITVLVQRPMALGQILSETPMVQKVDTVGKKSKRKIVIVLKNPADLRHSGAML